MNTTNTLPADTVAINQAVDSLLPFLPPGLVHLLAAMSILIVPLMIVGRLLLGFRQAGWFGAVSGLLTGSNVPRPLQDCPVMQAKVSAPTVQRCFLGVILSALIFTPLAVAVLGSGCAVMTTHQSTTTTTPNATNSALMATSTQETTATAWTFFDASDEISDYAASQSATNQSIAIGSASENSTSTNFLSLISSLLKAAGY